MAEHDLSQLEKLSERDLLEAQATARLEMIARECRADPVAFIEFVYRDEQGRKIVLADFQRQWIRDLQANRRCMFMAPPEHGKTVLLTIMFRLWEFGHNPNLRCALIMERADMGEKVVDALRNQIDGEWWDRLHLVFPNLRPALRKNGERLLWRNHAFQVQSDRDAEIEAELSLLELSLSAGVPSKERSYQAFGNFGKVDAGRYDRIDLDDILTFPNTRTKLQRDKVHDWLLETVLNRLLPGGRIAWMTNAWHVDDAAHREVAKGTWHVSRLAACNPEFASGGDLTFILWDRVWTAERLADKLRELGPVIFLRKFCNQAFDETTRLFLPEWISACLRRGRGMRFEHRTRENGVRRRETGRIITGVDLGIRKSNDSDLTSFFTIELLPNGDRKVLNIESGRWLGPKIVRRAIDHHERYDGFIFVEDNAAQDYIRQFTQEKSDALVRPFHTGLNKWDETTGVLSIGTELYNEKWIIPSGDWNGDDQLTDLSGLHPEVQAWIIGMLTFTVEDHTPDRLMAAWFAREGARAGTYTTLDVDLQYR
jgi:hypothetical protein